MYSIHFGRLLLVQPLRRRPKPLARKRQRKLAQRKLPQKLPHLSLQPKPAGDLFSVFYFICQIWRLRRCFVAPQAILNKCFQLSWSMCDLWLCAILDLTQTSVSFPPVLFFSGLTYRICRFLCVAFYFFIIVVLLLLNYWCIYCTTYYISQCASQSSSTSWWRGKIVFCSLQ